MSFRAALVAFGEDASSLPFLGHQFTEIAIRQPDGADASNPAAVGLVARDKIIEGTDGSDTAVNLRKLSDLSLSIDFVDAATKAKLERLYHDGREVYFCPNVGPNTRFSLPLQRGVEDFAGLKTVTNTRAGTAYFWDETEKVFRSWSQYDSAIDFNGHWTRYLRSQEGHQNKAAYPHPTSTNHGWSVISGSATFTYTEGVPTPVLQQRTVANQKGVVLVYAAAGATVTIKHDSAATLSTVNGVVASVCIAWHGTLLFALMPTVGGPFIDTVQLEGDGTFRLVKLGGPNTDARNQYRVVIYLIDSNAKKQAAIIGPTFIANSLSPAALPPVEDWNPGTAVVDYIASTDSVPLALTDFTFSTFFRWSEYEAGILMLGTGSPFIFSKTAYDALVLTTAGAASPMIWAGVFTELGAAGGWSVGDWIHLVLRGSDAGGLALFVNGIPHSLNGSKPWEPSNLDSLFRIAFFLPSSGMSHARLDAVAWSDDDIVDHYHTYFEDRGRGIVEPVFGKVYTIEELRLSPRGSSPVQWVGDLQLRELGPNENFAPMIRQEGDV